MAAATTRAETLRHPPGLRPDARPELVYADVLGVDAPRGVVPIGARGANFRPWTGCWSPTAMRIAAVLPVRKCL